MTTYHISGTVAWTRLGPFVTLGRGVKSKAFYDPNTGLTPSGATQNGVAITQVTADPVTGAWSIALDVLAAVIDFGAGPQLYMAQELPALLLIAAASSDAAIAAAVTTAGTATQSALNNRARMTAPSGTATANTTTLQTAVNDAATAGQPLRVQGAFSIDGQINVPSGSDIDFSLARITQTTNLTPILVLNNVTGVRLTNLRVQGKTSDYTNASGVYAAAAVRLTGTTSNVQIVGGSLLGLAGAGVYMAGTVSDVQILDCKMTGPGATYITSTSFNYSGGVVVDPGATKWRVDGCDISGFAQGIVTGDNLVDVRIANNYIHDIPGQHGLYLETMNGGVITGNLIRNTGLLGMKVQVGTTGANDADSITISDNVFINTGSQGILLDNPVGGTPRFRRVSITGNVVNTTVGHGIEVKFAVGAHISDNLVYNTSAGVRVASSSSAEVVGNRINKCVQDGINVQDSTDVILDGNRIVDPGSGNGASSEFGIHVVGVGTTSDVTIRDNKITDSLGNMRYGIYLESGDQTTMDVVGNYSTGATDYGARLQASTAIRAWRNNNLSGTTGSVLNPAPATSIDPFAGPSTYGLLGATCDPALAVANAAAMTAGVLYLHKVAVPQGGPINTVWLTVGVAGATLTSGQNFVGVYDAAGNRLAVSADLSTTVNSTGNKAISLTSATPSIAPGAYVYVAFLWNGTTSPQLRGISGAATAANINLAAAASRWATAGTSQTTLPSTLPTMTASTAAQWVGVS